MMARAPIVRMLLLGLGVGLAAGCGARAPSELAGLWSTGPAACEAGMGVRFGAHAIEAVYQGARETLFAAPVYEREPGGAGGFRMRIEYELPRQPGGAYNAGARGVITLERGESGFLEPTGHTLLDLRTGSARAHIGRDPVLAALRLAPCADGHLRRESLRGRSGA
jgi:hypothetical protein